MRPPVGRLGRLTGHLLDRPLLFVGGRGQVDASIPAQHQQGLDMSLWDSLDYTIPSLSAVAGSQHEWCHFLRLYFALLLRVKGLG